jgi:carbon-monoxide dehydrogenase medium subunit
MMTAKKLFRPTEYFKPASVKEAVKLLAQYGDKGSAIAGGTDVLAMRNPKAEALIDITGLGLSYIKSDDHGIRIGATTTLVSIEESPIINGGSYNILAQAAHKVGTPLIRNLGTIGGNLCNASPSADTPAALLALGSRLKLVSPRGVREVPLDEFFAGPFRTIKGHDELLTEILLPPLSPRTGTSYQWLTKITSIDESLVSVATLVVLDGRSGKEIIKDARIGLISVAPTPMRARKAEGMLQGKAIKDELIDNVARVVAEETEPRSRAAYRREISALLAGQTIREAIARAKKTRV